MIHEALCLKFRGKFSRYLILHVLGTVKFSIMSAEMWLLAYLPKLISAVYGAVIEWSVVSLKNN